MDPEVRFHSIAVVSEDLEEMNAPLPVRENQKNDVLFVLKEGCHYRRKLTFTVLHNIVSGLTYSNTVWKGGFQGEHFLSLRSINYSWNTHGCKRFVLVPILVCLLSIEQLDFMPSSWDEFQ